MRCAGPSLGLAFILETDDCRRTNDNLQAKRVEFTQEPTDQPYGVDCGLRDPFGNHIRMHDGRDAAVERIRARRGAGRDQRRGEAALGRGSAGGAPTART